jgi:hypothetical protein
MALGGTFGSGIIFKVSGTGHETVLYSFKGYPDGDTPRLDFIPRLGG